MMRHLTAAVLLLLGLCPAVCVAPKPNFVFILADDLGYSDLGCYGGGIATPNLDALANDGLRLTQFYESTRCWPSRAALPGGYYPQHIHRDKLPGVPAAGSGACGSRGGGGRRTT